MDKIEREKFELIMGLQQEMRDAMDPQVIHRIHCVLLVLQGLSARKVAQLFGTPARTVQLWVEKFEKFGLTGLADADRPGAPPRLGEKQILELDGFLRRSPKEAGMKQNLWDGKTLSAFLKSRYNVDLGIRQCQKLFRQFGFRLRKPRPEIKGADPEAQRAYKKTQKSPRKFSNRSLVC